MGSDLIDAFNSLGGAMVAVAAVSLIASAFDALLDVLSPKAAGGSEDVSNWW